MAPLPPAMRAAVYKGPRAVEVEQVHVPGIGPTDVLVRVHRCGVCGTDLHAVTEGWGRPGTIAGHEWSGTVVAVGDRVEHWSEGDRVVGGPPPGCGTCVYCRRGRPSLCTEQGTPGTADYFGAFADFVRVDASQLFAVPAGLDLRTAALAEPLAVALHAVTQGNVRPGASAMVFGVGPIGALAIAALRARGHDGRIVVVEPAPTRADHARRLGADDVLQPGDLDVPNMAEPGRIVDGAVDVVLECSGRRAAMEAGHTQLLPAGTLVLVGAGMEQPTFDPNRILLNELVVTGSFNYDSDGFDQALALLASGTLPVDTLLDPNDVGLDGLLDRIEALARGEIAGKVLVDPTIEEAT